MRDRDYVEYHESAEDMRADDIPTTQFCILRRTECEYARYVDVPVEWGIEHELDCQYRDGAGDEVCVLDER